MALSKEEAKRLSIISIAEQLGIELKRTGSYSYTWTEHDSFVIDARKNEFHWNSRTEFGDVIQLVQSIKGVSYKEAMHFLETGEFKQVNSEAQMAPKEPFHYNLERYENKDFSASRSYLKAQRGLSDDTINFFISQGSMAEATRKKGDYFEPVIVFKYKDNTGFLAGASLQGIVENRVHYPERGRLKQIMRNSDGQLGFSIDIGTPKRLVFAEAPIDLMSYYELHKDTLQDVRLVAMDGIKDGIISRRFMELYAEMNGKPYQVDQNAGKALETVARTTNYFKDGQHQDMITLAVDNDAAGQNFITRLQEKGIPVQIAIPPIVQLNQEKEDWNDFLKRGNEAPKELAHVYTADEKKSWHYQGFFEKELALAKAQELTADDVKAFVSDRQLTREEVRQEYTRIVDQEKERKHTMSEVHEAEVEYEVEKPDNSRLAQARRKLERLRGEQDEAISRAYSHQALTNGQPMNDKRGGASFMRKQEQIEGQVFSKMDEIRQQEEQSSAEKNIQLGSVESEEKEKSLEGGQETTNNSEQNKKAETKLGDFPEESQVAAPLPEANVSQPLNDLSPSQTRSQPLLHFSINEDRKSIHKDNYHPISDKDLRKLNRYAPHLQNAASWYLENVADSQVTYFYQDGADTNSLAISYNKESFMHLTGIYPYREGQTAGQTLLDFAAGNGQFDNILIANRGAAFDKLKVLPELPAIVDAESFYFGDLSDVEKFHSLNLDKAIRSNDQDVLLAFRTVDGTVLPASLMRLRQSLNLLLDQTNQEKIILGVFRERDGHFEQLSINQEYVKDKGAEMLSVLKNKQYEEVSKEIEQTIAIVRDEFEKSQEEEIKLEEQGHNKQELKRDADADGVSDEEELLQGTNPYDFRSKPGSKPEVDESLQADEVVLAAGGLAVADFIQNKDMAGLSRHLKEGIKEFLDSDKYKDYLTKMSQLNNYSNRNLRLILAQNPEARQVASFKQWKENFGRYVKKGEKALRIFKPMKKIKKDENNQPILDKNGKPETVTFFGLVPVFDVSQTEGKEMPKAAEVKEQLTDLDYANLYRALMAIAKENDVSVRFEEMENNKHGYYSVPENQIVLRSNEMNKAQIIKTFLHEMAHAELHHADNPQKENLTRSTAELQAESVAYVVSSYYGIDTSEYSFNYLSGWSADKETLADLEAQLDIVQQEAKSLMVRMDQALEQLRLSQEKQTKRSFEQKLEKFKDQSKQAVEDHKQELKADAQSKKEKGFSK